MDMLLVFFCLILPNKSLFSGHQCYSNLCKQDSRKLRAPISPPKKVIT